LAAANSRLMVSQRNAQGEEKLEAAVGTTWCALPPLMEHGCGTTTYRTAV